MNVRIKVMRLIEFEFLRTVLHMLKHSLTQGLPKVRSPPISLLDRNLKLSLKVKKRCSIQVLDGEGEMMS